MFTHRQRAKLLLTGGEGSGGLQIAGPTLVWPNVVLVWSGYSTVIKVHIPAA